LKPSLSMIVPIHNGASTLSSLLAQAVEILPELAVEWDLLVVDDGSTDASPEVLAELTKIYPQVRVLHLSEPQGDNVCFHMGARCTRGDILLLRASDCDLGLAGLHKMWKRGATHDLVVARSAGDSALGRAPATARRKAKPAGASPALQMVRRRAVDGWLMGRDGHDLQAYLAAKRYPQHEVELRPASSAIAPPHRLPAPMGRKNRAQQLPQHCDAGEPAGGPKRPNYLLRLKAFALGE
jgi:hypothetical protein